MIINKEAINSLLYEQLSYLDSKYTIDKIESIECEYQYITINGIFYKREIPKTYNIECVFNGNLMIRLKDKKIIKLLNTDKSILHFLNEQ